MPGTPSQNRILPIALGSAAGAVVIIVIVIGFVVSVVVCRSQEKNEFVQY